MGRAVIVATKEKKRERENDWTVSCLDKISPFRRHRVIRSYRALSAGGTGYKFFKTDQSQLIRAGSADWPPDSSREAVVCRLLHSRLFASRRDLMSTRLSLTPHDKTHMYTYTHTV